ncbi:hypothetical protein QWY99_17290 [Flavobacterium branchiarum]|uniref:Lipoprotein n=1 Tax=Flavobacterium branchiarum TaxID=1114870 RepID=A0ABV5FMH5_9FLAO|nr:hypothetical protein [Flavobacterium branchiarum]MDN3674796.1 hypothetical protein [Flavobacterium branchiarum]
MIKKVILMSLVLSQLTISCSSDNDETKTETEIEQTLADQIANILKQPYSSLNPADQKIKLEAEANEMLVQLDKSKSSGAIEAMENLEKLLDISPVDVFGGKNGNKVEDILKVADVYGIYTWSNTNKNWEKTTSTTYLKFIFPAKTNETENNATFSAKSVSSEIKVKMTDSYGYWSYPKIGDPIYTVGVDDYFFLPLSADATLTINNLPIASFTQTAKYANGKEIPTDFAYKVTLNDGYTWEMSGTKATTNTSKASFAYNGKNLVEFNAGSTAQIDALIDNPELAEYRGKANGLIQLMDNFVIIADIDLVAETIDDKALRDLEYPTYPSSTKDPKNDYKAFYTDQNTYRRKLSEATATNFNKNIKLTLVSKKDGTKIANVIMRSERQREDNVIDLPVWNEEYEYWSSWNEGGETFTRHYFEEVYYLKFNDNTQIAMSAYFSEGFENLHTKFDDFLKNFTDRNN